MNTLRRIAYQLRRWWFLRSVRECRRCDGTGMEVVTYYGAGACCDELRAVTCPACAGNGWLSK